MATSGNTAQVDRGRAFTAQEAAAFLGFPLSKVYRLIATRRIRHIKAGRFVIYEAWCEEFLERHTRPPVDDTQRLREELAQTAKQGPTGIDDLLRELPKRRFPRAAIADDRKQA